MHDAKTNFSKLLSQVQAGHEIVITKAGRPVAKLVPYEGPPGVLRRPGGWEGRVHIADDFDELPAEMLNAFEGVED